MAMVTAVELDDLIAPRESAGQADGAHAGFRAGIANPDLLNARYQPGDPFGHRHLGRIGNAKAGPAVCRILDRPNDSRMGVAENGWTPGPDVINQFIAIDVPHVGTSGLLHKERLSTHGAEGAHRRVNASGDVV